MDEDTGAVAVERVWVAHDCVSRSTARGEGHVQGAVWMGMGHSPRKPSTTRVCAAGQHARLPDPDDRRIAADRGEDRRKRRSARAVRREGGERGLRARLAPALANAICDAIGIRLTDLPASRIACSRRSRRKAQEAGAGKRRCLAQPGRAGNKHGTHAEFDLKRPRASPRPRAMPSPSTAAQLLAGGTDLVPKLRRGIDRPSVLVDLGGRARIRAHRLHR